MKLDISVSGMKLGAMSEKNLLLFEYPVTSQFLMEAASQLLILDLQQFK